MTCQPVLGDGAAWFREPHHGRVDGGDGALDLRPSRGVGGDAGAFEDSLAAVEICDVGDGVVDVALPRWQLHNVAATSRLSAKVLHTILAPEAQGGYVHFRRAHPNVRDAMETFGRRLLRAGFFGVFSGKASEKKEPKTSGKMHILREDRFV